MNNNDNDVPMIPKHQAELHDMNLVHQNSNMKWLCIFVVATLAIVVLGTSWANVEMSRNSVNLAKTFVDNYTTRTEKWLGTLLRMQTGKGSITEVLNEEKPTGYVQQLPFP